MKTHKVIAAIKYNLTAIAIVSTCLFYNINTSYAQLFFNLANQDQVTRMQDRQIQRRQIEDEKEQIKKRKKLLSKPKKTHIFKKTSTIECFKIKEIQLNKNKFISQKYLTKISLEYLNKCLTKNIVKEIKSRIYVKINDKGYITSQVIMPKQNISTGIIKFEIAFGMIGKIRLNEDDFTDEIQKFLVFGNLTGKVLDVKDLNQGLFQINKLPSSNSKMKIVPSDKDGYSDIIIKNERNFPLRASVTHDNLGNDFTGVKRFTFSSSTDNLLSLSENLNLSFTNNLNDSNSKKEMESANISMAIPFRYYTISYNYSDTDYMGKVTTDNENYTINGYSRRKTISLARSLIHKDLHSLNISSALTMKDTGSQNILNSSSVDSNRKRLAILDLSLSFSRSSKSFNIFLKPTILQGLSKFGADKDLNDAPLDQAKNQFRAYRLYFNINKPVQIGKIRVTFSSEADGQLSEETLHGSEQFSIGGYYSVRGFRENYISGDHGYYIRNKINVNLGSIASPPLKEYPKIASKLYNISLEPFFDYGSVRDKVTSTGGRLSGAGIATTYNGKYINSSITYSRGLNRSKLIDPALKKEKHAIYLQLSVGF